MIMPLVLVLTALAVPVQETSALEQKLIQAAIDYVPVHLRGTVFPDTYGLEPEAYAISHVTIGGEGEIVKDHLEDWYSSVIAAELVESYLKKGRQPVRLGADLESEIEILDVDAFRRGSADFDWKALQRVYPDVKVIIQISRPGIDRVGAFATVRYEVFTPLGRRWASFTEFTKTPTGAWEFDKAVVGNLWSRGPRGTETKLRDASAD